MRGSYSAYASGTVVHQGRMSGACPHPLLLLLATMDAALFAFGMNSRHQQPPHTPLCRSTSAAKSGQVDAVRALMATLGIYRSRLRGPIAGKA